MAEEKPTRYDKLMKAGDRMSGYSLSTDQTQALGVAVIAEQIAILNQSVEILTAELRTVRDRMP